MKSPTILFLLLLMRCSSDHAVSNKLDYPYYEGDENVFTLLRSFAGSNQYLLPVEIGNQTFRMLIDTGSNALLLFKDTIDQDNFKLSFTGEILQKKYSSTVRRGFVATAPVRIGGYSRDDMRIMVVESPSSSEDPSISRKKADGVIGLRRTDGLAESLDDIFLDVPLSVLRPEVAIIELDLGAENAPAMSFGITPALDLVDSVHIFRSKTYTLVEQTNKVKRSFSEIQLPFVLSSSAGKAEKDEQDILLDTGAVSKLVIDKKIARKIGYDPFEDKWSIPVYLYDVADKLLIELPGINSAQDDSAVAISGDGSLLAFHSDRKEGFGGYDIYLYNFDDKTLSVPEGLNSAGNERKPGLSSDGNFLVFESDRGSSNDQYKLFLYAIAQEVFVSLGELNNLFGDLHSMSEQIKKGKTGVLPLYWRLPMEHVVTLQHTSCHY